MCFNDAINETISSLKRDFHQGFDQSTLDAIIEDARKQRSRAWHRSVGQALRNVRQAIAKLFGDLRNLGVLTLHIPRLDR